MSSSTSNNMAALVAAIEGSEGNGSSTSAKSHRRSLGLPNGPSRLVTDHPRTDDGFGAFRDGYSQYGPHSYESTVSNRDGRSNSSALLDDDLLPIEVPSNPKPRGRRASEGIGLSKSEAKRASGELKCNKCGKGYKHGSCLTKHLWVPLPALPLHCIYADLAKKCLFFICPP